MILKSFKAKASHRYRRFGRAAARASVLAGLVVAAIAAAEAARPEPRLPGSLNWLTLPGNPLLRGAWVVGAEGDPGIYLFRVELAHGGKLPPHTHPDTRYSTVLSGTLYVGFGATEDLDALVAVPAGAVYEAPAGVPHYLFAKDGDVVYEEVGTGPTGMTFMNTTDGGSSDGP